MDQRPKVSVIIPCRNNELGLGACLLALENQTYPQEKLEVIVVKNCWESSSNFERKFPNVTFMSFDSHPGSFASRNEGAKKAKGEILAFTDSDCVPHRDWIENALRTMQGKSCDMVGGRIAQIVSNEKSAAQIVDAINNLRHDLSIPHRSVAFTANLFVRKTVFEQVGSFDEVTSGGDALLVSRAVRNGFSIEYCPHATVEHPARSWRSLLKKARRIGAAKLFFRRKNADSLQELRSPHIANLHPPHLYSQAQELGFHPSFGVFARMITLQWSYVIILCTYAILGRTGAGGANRPREEK